MDPWMAVFALENMVWDLPLQQCVLKHSVNLLYDL